MHTTLTYTQLTASWELRGDIVVDHVMLAVKMTAVSVQTAKT